MSTMSYISVIERYHEYREAIQEMLASILTGVSEPSLMGDKQKLCSVMQSLGKRYPFVDLMYVLDKEGVQVGDNVAVSTQHRAAYAGDGKSRQQRPYFKLAKNSDEAVVTEPYLSIASRKLCLSVAVPLRTNGDRLGYVILDVDLGRIIEFLMGDAARRKFQPFFKWVYGIIVAGLFTVVAVLLFTAFYETFSMFSADTASKEAKLKPFGVIIFLTLALAIFDLGKTTLEEEVLMHKDIFRHSSTRRTITRFIAAILIAVSIEALLLMFKSALGETELLVPAVWMMLAAVGLLIGLGIYVYLGAQAEAKLSPRLRR